MKKHRAWTMLSCVSLLALSTPALAQQLDQTTVDGATLERADRADIIVTGSRVIANGDDSPTPLTVLSIAQSEDVNPGNVSDQLNDLPQFSGSIGQTTQAGPGSANNGTPNNQAAVLNMRNFGTTRNLVLFDGHRVAPNSPNGTVDINMIPQMLLKRVDVVTGGASAVYGADAVSGVVNFVTDTRFRGVKMHAQAGISEEGDGATYDFGVAWGGQIGDRLHVLASYQYRKDEGIMARSDRGWGRQRYTMRSLGTSGGTANYLLVTNAGRPNASFGGTISQLGGTPNPLVNQYFVSPGILAPVTGDQAGGLAAGNSTGSYFDPSLRGSLDMQQAFARLEYELTDSISFYARGAYTDTQNFGFSISNPTYQPNGSNAVPIFLRDPLTGAANPLIPTSVFNTLNAAGVTSFAINKVHSGPGMQQYRQSTDSYSKNWSIDTGFNGEFGSGWRWETALIHSNNEMRTVQNNAINGRKLMASLDAVTEGGQVKCWVNTAAGRSALAGSGLESLYQGCVPYASIFGPTLTDAEADWIFDPLSVTTKTKMTDFEAYLSGSPFDTWAGPVNVAVSVQARKLSYAVRSSQEPAGISSPLNCAGLRRISCSATNLEYFQAESASRSNVSVSTKEAALELNVPLLADKPFFEMLAINGAYRISDYSTSGGISSWKAGMDWNVGGGLSFRATRSRDVRAPTMHELFAPEAVGNFNGRDELLGINLDGTGTNPQPAGAVQSGNSALDPERADTFTFGLVYRPEWLSGVSFALDYYDIKVKDAIVTYNGGTSSVQQDCIQSGGTSATCALIVRSIDCCSTTTSANAITRVFQRPINIGSQYTRGVDAELNYVGKVADRPTMLRLFVSYQPKNVQVDALSGVKTDLAGGHSGDFLGHPEWRATMMASMEVTRGVKISVQERYRGAMDWFAERKGTGVVPLVLTNGPKDIPARWYTNLNVSFDVGPTEFFVNVQNLFNQTPAVYASTAPFAGLNSVAPGDDPVGRYFTAGVRAKF